MCACVRICACLSYLSCGRVYACVGVCRFMGPPVKWNWGRYFSCLTNPNGLQTRMPGKLSCLPPTLFLDLVSFSKLSVFVWNSQTASLLPEEWTRIYSSNQMWWQWERVWSGAGKPCVRRKEESVFLVVCAELDFVHMNVNVQFWLLCVH